MSTDYVGDNIQASNASWSFGGNTPKNFTNHAEKSIPFYHEGHELITSISDYFVKPNSTAIDLGCSTGTLTKKLALHHTDSTQWIGLDEELLMTQEAEKNNVQNNLKFFNDNILLFDFPKSDLIIAYYTIQFIAPRYRQELINKIFNSLNWGGAFIMFEKVRGPDARFQDILTGLYTDFKLDKGHQPNEIIAKSRSLKGILEPFSSQGNLDLLKRAGFKDIMTIYKYMCFEGFMAIK